MHYDIIKYTEWPSGRTIIHLSDIHLVRKKVGEGGGEIK